MTRYIRIDEAGRAMPIAYNDLDYSPREGEIRTFLTDWATLPLHAHGRHHGEDLSEELLLPERSPSPILMSDDLKNRTVALVAAGQTEENDVQINNVTFTSLGKERIRNAPAYTGTAIIDLFKIFAATNPAASRTLAGVGDVLSESGCCFRASEDRAGVRDRQSARADHHRVPRIAGGMVMAFDLILPFLPEPLRELILDAGVSDSVSTEQAACGSSGAA